MQTCTRCAASKPLDQYYDRVKWQGGKHRSCKECMAYDCWVRRLLAACNPKPEARYVCGATDRRLEIEHCHTAAEIEDPRQSYRGARVPSLQSRKTAES